MTPAPTAKPPAPRVDIVIPVHNRRAVTLRCLANLRTVGALAWARAVIVDDGSTDGTADAVRAQFPEAVVLPGDGDLWWGGAIRLGMGHAFEQGAELICWLNDDCTPHPGTLERLARHAADRRVIAVGQAFTPSGVRYGAFRRTRTWIQPIQAKAGEVLPCDAFGGNCVCLPRAVVEQIGLPDARHFPHVYGDADYGLRARRAGWRCEVLGDAVCDNEDNLNAISGSWLLSSAPFRRIFAGFFTRRSDLYIPAYFCFQWRHWGLIGLRSFVLTYLKFFLYGLVRLLVPRRWLLAWVGPRSTAWKRESFGRG